MKRKASALSVIIIILGFLEFVSNGYDIIGGGVPIKSWVMFIFGLLMMAVGFLLIFGKSEQTQIPPKEEYRIWLGICIGWGASTFVNWLDRDCVIDHYTVFYFLILAFFIVWTILKKKRISEE